MGNKRWLAIVGPGLLVAATGVGAGDLASAGFAGSRLGPAILWAVVFGAILKFVLTEGLARWQLATGETLLDGAMKRAFWVVGPVMALYLTLWSFFVAMALMKACGVTAQALFSLHEDPATGVRWWAILHGFAGLVLVRLGGYKLFEKVMSAFIAMMFIIVVVTAVLLRPDIGEVARGLFVPGVPVTDEAADGLVGFDRWLAGWRGDGITWTIGLIGGVGGTVTMLSYGYWIREEGRITKKSLGTCRLDLALGYTMTAVFGVCMVIIATGVEVTGGGAALVADLGTQLEGPLGAPGKWAFLVGAWGAVFSSLLGVWQAVPYLFADWLRMCGRGGRSDGVAEVPLTSTRSYWFYMVVLAVVPMLGLGVSFERAQLLYTLSGAAFVPLLAIVLLVLNNRRSLVGELRNRWLSNAVLAVALGVSVVAAIIAIDKAVERFF